MQNLLLAPMLLAAASAGASAATHLTIRMFDYVGLVAGTRAEVDMTATHILRSAGIQIQFIECYVRGVLDQGGRDCAGPLGTADVALRILEPKLAMKAEQAGYAAMTAEGGAYVTVFVDPEHKRARIGSLSNGVFLGHAVGHEIGHLLLGPSSHSPSGIMRPFWRPCDEEWMVKGVLLFDAGQGVRMRAALNARGER